MSDDESLTDPYEGELPADPDLAPAPGDTKDDDTASAAEDALQGGDDDRDAERATPLS